MDVGVKDLRMVEPLASRTWMRAVLDDDDDDWAFGLRGRLDAMGAAAAASALRAASRSRRACLSASIWARTRSRSLRASMLRCRCLAAHDCASV